MSTIVHGEFSDRGAAPMTLRARWVFPVSAPPLENATVEIARGRIAAVHDRPGPVTRDLGNAALVPGLVNAHTHLELSDLAGPFSAAGSFTGWLQNVIAHRRRRAGPDVERCAVAAGAAESIARGTTTIGDITTADRLDPGPPGVRTVAFLELLGLAPDRVEGQLQRAREHLSAAPAGLAGLSPHAPYSVHPDLFHALVNLAVERHAPLAMHLAESRAELELLAAGTGEFVPFLKGLGVWRDGALPLGSRPLDFLRELARAPRGLVIHGNYLDDDDLEFLAVHPSISVVYCPRTHRHFGHEPHPWRRLLAHGVNVALGTDSRASNPDLSLFGELFCLREIAPDCDPARLLPLATLNGARALGLADETGSLEVGKSADLAVVSLAAGRASDPYSLLFDSENTISATLHQGRVCP